MLVQIISGEKTGLTGTLLGFTNTEGVVGLSNSTEIIQIPLNHLKPIEDFNKRQLSSITSNSELYNPDYHELSFQDTFNNEFLQLLEVNSSIHSYPNEFYSLIKSYGLFELVIHYLLITKDLFIIQKLFRVINNYTASNSGLTDYVTKYHGITIQLLFSNICKECPAVSQLIIYIYSNIVKNDSIKYLNNLDNTIKFSVLDFIHYYLSAFDRSEEIVLSCCHTLSYLIIQEEYNDEFNKRHMLEDIMQYFIIDFDELDRYEEDFTRVLQPVLVLIETFMSIEVIKQARVLVNRIFGQTIDYEYKKLFNINVLLL